MIVISSDIRVIIVISCLSAGAELQLGQDLGGNVLIFVIFCFILKCHIKTEVLETMCLEFTFSGLGRGA